MKRAVLMAEGRAIDAVDLELAVQDAANDDLDLRAARLRAEREVLQKAMARCGGRLAQAAKLLGVSRPTLYSLMESHGIAADHTLAAGSDTEHAARDQSAPL